jgi:hypothetical protein
MQQRQFNSVIARVFMWLVKNAMQHSPRGCHEQVQLVLIEILMQKESQTMSMKVATDELNGLICAIKWGTPSKAFCSGCIV